MKQHSEEWQAIFRLIRENPDAARLLRVDVDPDDTVTFEYSLGEKGCFSLEFNPREKTPWDYLGTLGLVVLSEMLEGAGYASLFDTETFGAGCVPAEDN